MAASLPNHVEIQKADNFSAALLSLKQTMIYHISYNYKKHV